MSYVITKKVGGKEYKYLVKNTRVGGKWKKFTIYLGAGHIGGEELRRLVRRRSKALEEKVSSYLRNSDPFYSLLSAEQIKKLAEVKRQNAEYQKRLPEEAKRNHYENFVTKFTYNTSAIEGSTVTLRETALILFEGIVPAGRTVREVREIENHKKAFDAIPAYGGDVDKRFVCRLHRILTDGIVDAGNSGRFRMVQVYISGADFVPTKPENVDGEFKKLMKWYSSAKRKYHPIVIAAYFHCAFESIHPFIDFNGRTGRLLLNFILLKNGFPAVDIKDKDKARYYDALQEYQKGNLKPFVELIYRYIVESNM
jgi:Fic family protein